MDNRNGNRIISHNRLSAWSRRLLLILAAVLVLGMPLLHSAARAEGENGPVTIRSIRFEFDDNDNAANLRPTGSNSVYVYYGTSSSSGWYYLYASNNWTVGCSFTNIVMRYFSLNNTTSNNWQYYNYTGWRMEGEQAVLTMKLVPRVEELEMTVRWSDNHNADSIRPAIADFEPHLWFSSSNTSVNGAEVTGAQAEIQDHQDDTWTVRFTGLDFQPSKTTNRYLWLTWLDKAKETQAYFNQSKSSGSMGSMVIDLMGNDTSVTAIAHSDPTLHATITWDDSSNILGKRPATSEFQPSLLLSSSNTSTSGAKPVTIGENGYTITDNGNDTWSIDFTDVNVKEVYSENTSYRYLWLTWEGSDYYANQMLASGSGRFGASYSDVSNLNAISWTVRSSVIRSRLSWKDYGDANGTRPSAEEVKSSVRLLLSGSTASTASASDVTGSEITVTDNGDDTWDVIFWDSTARKNQSNSARYLYLIWNKDGSYVNESAAYAQSGVTYNSLTSYNTGASVLPYNQVPKALNVTINWRDNGNEFNLRPDASAFQPKLYVSSSTSALTESNSKEVTGDDYTITENGNTWKIVFNNTTARDEQNSYRYLWLTWDGNGDYLNETKAYYYSGGNVPYVDLMSYSTADVTFAAMPAYVAATLTWNDQGDAAGLRPRPDPEAFDATLHFSTSSSSIAGDTVITTGDYTIRDNENNTWTILFRNTDLPLKLTGGTRYIWLTWTDREKETQFYANGATATTEYGYTYSSANYNYTYSGESKLSFAAKPKVFQFRLNWGTPEGANSDNNNFAQTRPTVDHFAPHLWGSTSSSNAASATDLTGTDWSVREYDDYWVVTLNDADEALFRGVYSYFWLTWEDTSLGEDEASQYYFNQSKATSQHGYTYQAASSSAVTFTAWPKVFSMKLTWKDGGDSAGLRPSPDDIAWHLWYGGSSSAAGSTDVGGTKWVVTDNGDGTWTVTFLNSDFIRYFYSGNTLQNNAYYTFITWDGSDYYYNDVKNNELGRIRYYTNLNYAGKSGRFNGNSSYWYQINDSLDGIYPKAIKATLSWRDSGNAFGHRPSVEEFTPHLRWYSNTSDFTNGTDVTGSYEITDNGDDTWTILFKDTNARKLTGTNTRYLCLTWDGSDQYYNTALTSNDYGLTYDTLTRTVTDVNFIARQKPFTILLNWEDGDNKMGYRPSPSEFTPHVWRSNANNGNKVEITGANWTVKDNGDNTWTLTFPEPENLTGLTADQAYIWLTWDGSDQYYNNVKDTSFGYMRESFTNDDPYYVMTTRPKHRELPLVLNWDDFSNGRDTRPDPTQFTPHLWYQASNYAGGTQSIWVEIEAQRDEDYVIITDQDSENKWIIRYLAVPTVYNQENQSTTVQTKISNYVLTWEGSDEYYNDVMDSGAYGYMAVSASSYAPSVTTHLKDRSLDLTLVWSDFSDQGGYRPTPEEFRPQLYFGTNVRANVPIEIEDGSWTVTDNGDDTWLIHFDSVPYAVKTNSGSSNTYSYYWLTWTGSDEYLNQLQKTSNSSYTTGCMFFSRESSAPRVTTYLKTRDRSIKLNWVDNQDQNGWRPTPEELVANMHLWAGDGSSAKTEIPLDSVEIILDDTTTSPDAWDITIRHLPYYYDNGGYITNYSNYWLTWDGEHYINQVKNTVTPGAMYFVASSSARTQVNCYPDETEKTMLYFYWYDSHDAQGFRPDPENFHFQIHYGTDRLVSGVIPESEYTWELKDTSYTSGSTDRWDVEVTGLPRSFTAEDGSETAFTYYWVTFTDPSGEYISSVVHYGYNGYFTNRFSNLSGSASVYNYLNHRGNVSVTLTWDDNRNADGLRPSPADFVPHLGYSEYNNSARQLGVFDDVAYEIQDNGNNTWTITFKQAPIVFNYSEGDQEPAYYYWFTCDDVDGYTVINDYNTNNYSRSNYVRSSDRTNSYTMTAKLSRQQTKNLDVTLNWQDSANAWGRRPATGSFVPHLWAGDSSAAHYEIPLTADQWEITETSENAWKLSLKNIDQLTAGYYWLTWDGSDSYYNQFKTSARTGYMYWSYSNTAPNVYVYPRKTAVTLNWQDGSNTDGKRPDPNDWTPVLHYGTVDGVVGDIPLNANNWHVKSASGDQWVVEFYNLPDRYTDGAGNPVNISYYWLTFDTQDGYYCSDKTTSEYGEMKWGWSATGSPTLYVYPQERPLTINLTFSDLNGTIGVRPEATPESLGAHLWYGDQYEALGEIEGLTYTVTDNGNNTWTIVFDSAPGYYTAANGKATAIPYYWFTYDGGQYFLNNIRNTYSGSHGAMYRAKNSTNVYDMTTYCDYYRVGVKVNWVGTGNIANVTNAEIDRSHAAYDLVDTVTGEVLDTWEPETPASLSYTHTFYLPKYDENGEAVDHHRYTVVERGKPAVFELSQTSKDYTSGIAGHEETITNTAMDKLYRFNFTFVDDNNALKLRPSTLQYLASEEEGKTYTYRSGVSISSAGSSFSSSIISLLGRDLLTGDELDYALEFTNLGKYYDIQCTERLDDEGIINLDYTFTLKTQPVTLQVAWADDGNDAGRRPEAVTEYLMANGINLFQDNRFVFAPADAREDDPNVWEKVLVLPVVDADGNAITWSLKQEPQVGLRYYHAEQESTQEPDFGGQTVTLTNILQDNWNYAVDLYWVSYGNRGSLPDKDYIDEANKYDIYETVDPRDDYQRAYKYQLSISVNSAHYDVGDLEVRLPYYVKALDSNGNATYVAPLNPTNDISVPKAPNVNPRYSFNYYIDDHGTADKGDDEIVFVNWEELNGSPNVLIQVIYKLLPHQHLDTHIYELQATGTGYATLHYDDETHTGDREDVADVQQSNTITFGMDNGVDITSFTKRNSEPVLLYYYNTSYINSSHLPREAFDTDNFDYVAYNMYYYIYANQRSTFTITDLPGQNGEIVSIKESRTTSSMSVSSPTYSADKRVWTYTISPTASGTGSSCYVYGSPWVVVAYPKTDGNIIMEDGRVFKRYTNEADIEAEAAHPQNPDGKTVPPPDHNDEDAMNDATFIEWGDYRWKPSGKIFYYDKALNRNFNSGNTNRAPGGQTVLEYGENIEAAFNMTFYVNGDELALDGVHEYYRFNITDNELWLHGTVGGSRTTFVKLEPGDYEITAISASVTARRTDHQTGEPLPNPPLGRFVLQGQTNETGQPGGEWINLASYTWPESDATATPKTLFSLSGLAGRGITGYRVMTPRVNEYLNVTTSFTVQLNAESEKVKALLENGELLTEIEMLNIAAFPMEIEEPDGSWSLYTNIYRQYDGMVMPGVPSHTDNQAVLVGLYGHDADRLEYGDQVELIYDHALAQATPITSGVNMQKSTDSVVADSLTEIVKATFTLNACQTISNTTGIPLWLQHEIVIREGYYYDLLPEGWGFDPTASVIVRRYNGGAATLVGDPVIIDDYKGTNRQMVIFHVKAEGDVVNYSGSTSGFIVTFGAEISYEDNGTYPRGYNIAVFQGVEYDDDGNPMTDGNGNYVPQVWELMHTNTSAYHDDGVFDSSVYNVIRDDGKNVFYDVNGDGITDQNDVMYMYSFVNPNYAKSVQTGVDKLVMGKSGVWQRHDVTDLDADYYYHLSYRTTGQGTSRNVIIYDVLEKAANTAGHKDEKYWQGAFVDVDVSYARAQGIDAKVYYSTATNLDENNNFTSRDNAGNPLPDSQIQMDIVKRSDLWYPYDSATAPKDQITAIAVDLRMRTDGTEMVFDGYDNSETYFVVSMHSPEELPDDPDAILAYNRPCYQCIVNSGGGDEEKFNINDRVTIELQDLKTVTLKKLTRSDPVTDENGVVVLDEDGNVTFEEMPLGSVFFQLYKVTCTDARHTSVTSHTAPPATSSVTGSSSNSCWTRVAVGQTRSDGTVSFENLESGTYALREYNTYYTSGDTNTYAYIVPTRYRLERIWWSFEVDTRSKAEPELIYRGTYYTADSYQDFAFGTKDSQIIPYAEGDLTLTRTVWNVRSRQSLTIKKQWWPADSDTAYGIDSIKVNILRNGELYIKDVELTKAGGWTATIKDLPVTSAYGTRYHYTIQETEETRAALEEYGFKVVVDNNSYTSLSGSATEGYSQERRLHNSTLDHLMISKSVTEGGDRNKQYLFQLKLTDQESSPLAGSYDYIRYQLVEGEDGTQTWVAGDHGTFRLDGSGAWGQMLLAHNERIVIEGLPIGTNYVITEIGADGYTQTTTKGSLSGQIKASDDDEDMESAAASHKNEVAVTNTYRSEGRNKVSANKTINGRRPVYFTDHTFTYYLNLAAWHQEDAEEGAADAVTTYILNGSSRQLFSYTAQNGNGYSVNNGADGVITFPTMIWQTGVSGYKGYRVYTLREKTDPPRAGFDLDKTVFVIWVDLEDDETGTMKSTLSFYRTVLQEGETNIDIGNKDSWEKLNSLSDLTFDNIYSAEGELRLRLTKTINSLTPKEGGFARKTFSYTIYENVNDRLGQVLMHLENDEDGFAEATLGQFTIDHVGNNQFFRYFLKEDVLDEAGITIDSILYGITAQITDKGQGRLGAKLDIVYTKNGKRTTIPTINVDLPQPIREGEEPAADYDQQLEAMLTAISQRLKFDNKYEAQGSWQIGVRKLVNSEAIDTSHYQNHSFTFTLSSLDSSGRETKLKETTNNMDVTALFDQVEYTAADINKTVTYVIHETGSSGSGITVNDVPWRITLRVDDAGKGVLTPKVLLIRHGDETVWREESDEPMPAMTFDFDNPYQAQGSLTIEGTKELAGRSLRDKEFRFAIMDGEENIVSTGTSDQDGKITFQPILYTQADAGGHYEYRVYEVNNNLDGITYDDLEWKLTVDVTDRGDGTLAIVYKLSKLETP